jgi:drug/metabolite transporter (DMT)-like permease
VTDRARRFVGYAMVALAAAQWGTWPLVLHAADAVRPTPAVLQSTIVLGIVALASAPLVLRDRIARRATAAQWAGIAWLGAGDALNATLFFRAYAVTSVGIAVTTHFLAPIFVAIASPLLLRERLAGRTWLAVAAAFGGLVLLLRPWGAAFGASDVYGAALGAGSAVFYASNVIMNKRLVGAFSGSELVCFHCACAFVGLAPFVPAHAWAEVHPRAFAILAVGALGPGTFAGLLFTWALRRIPASHATILTLLEPLVAFAVGVLVMHQPLALVSLVGGLFILGSAAIVMTVKGV